MVLILVSLVFLLYASFKFIRRCFAKENDVDNGYVEAWFGKGEIIKDEDESIRPFKIAVADEILADLKSRLSNSRFEDSLEDSCFNYGFNNSYLQEIATYWKDKYDWRKEEAHLNSFPQFKTKIEGIDVHFLHIKPSVAADSNIKVLPLLMVHGWPGSFVEFLKIIPLLTTPYEGFAFEVICPSIPGYGFSESPHQKGFNQRAAARMFVTLMKRLGHPTFYAQGGDWGSFITRIIATYYPSTVRGLHLNMLSLSPNTFLGILKISLISFFPFLVSEAEYKSMFPLKKKFFAILRETGYFHFQATKPDTVGSALADSPIGLAAYIMEKFSTWTDDSNIDIADGGLTKKFTLDELLTNIMVYWVNNNIKASVRFYKEYILDPGRMKHDSKPLTVPTGISLFPNELMGIPKMLIDSRVTNLVSYTIMPRGGHFAAFEEPELVAEDVKKFVKLVEEKNQTSP